ncbi:tetratricopeptide repeat protein [Veronia pacifica]|uniref:Tetratricopeptide repeat protein n=1 Tax=Veronia pacifica TaxID=1080227 RepID=A0A1C3E6Z6_9GAMM|nr:tetratricopeptide repeat protein [Veronia pacifica]ODA29020.1 hypothetical protein A8L45_22895 [Veronia pacifica]
MDSKIYHNLSILLDKENKFKEAMNYASKASRIKRELAKNDLETFGLCAAGSHLQYARFVSRSGAYQDAIDLFYEVIDIIDDLDEKNSLHHIELVANSYCIIAQTLILKNKNNVSEIKKFFKESIRLYRIIYEQTPQVFDLNFTNTLNKFASFLRVSGFYYDSKKYQLEAVEIYENRYASDPDIYKDTFIAYLNALGCSYSKIEDYLAAIKTYKKALFIINNSDSIIIKHDDLLINLYTNIGVSYAEIGMVDESHSFYKKAESTFNQTDSIIGISTKLNLESSIARYYVIKDDFPNAIKHYINVLNDIKETKYNNDFFTAECLGQLGFSLLSVSNYSDAESKLKESISILKTLSFEKRKKRLSEFSGYLEDVRNRIESGRKH